MEESPMPQQHKVPKLIIHTDGGARGNPGPAAIGVHISDGERILDTFGKVIGEHMTNNQAEYLAVEAALQRALGFGAHELELYLDSELVARQLRREYKIKNQGLAEIFIRVWNLMQRFRRVSIHVIAREENMETDALVNAALDKAGY